MPVIFETDTGISKEFFESPNWDSVNVFFVIRADRNKLPNVLMNLQEWVRQIEKELDINTSREESNV